MSVKLNDIMDHGIRTTSTVVAVSSQVSTELDGDVVILELNAGIYYGLSDVSRSIWNRLGKPIQVSTLCNALLEEYEIGREQCEQETIAFLDEMAALGLIEIVHEPDS